MASNTVEQIFVELLLNAKGYNKDADEAKKKSDQLEGGLKDVEKQSASTNKNILTLGEGLRKTIKGIAGLTALIAAGTGLLKLAEEARKANDELNFLSQNLGMSSQNVKAWQGAAAAMGGSAQGMTSDMKNLNKSMNDFVTKGDSSLLPYFNTLGVSMVDAKGKIKDTDAVMLDLADSMSKMNREQAFALGQDMGFDEGTINTLLQGRDAMKQMVDYHKQMYSSNKQDLANSRQLSENQAKMSAHWASMKLMIGNAVLPLLIKLSNVALKFFEFLQKHQKTVKNVFEGMAIIIGTLLVPVLAKALIALTAFIAPFAPFLIVVGALGAAFIALYDDYKVWAEGGKSLFNWGAFSDYIDKSKLSVDNLTNAFGNLAKKIVGEVVPTLKGYASIINKVLDRDFSGAIEESKGMLANFGNKVGDFIDDATGQKQGTLAAAVGNVVNNGGNYKKTNYGKTLTLSEQDVIDIMKVASTEVVGSLKGADFEKQTAGVIDTILNRAASGKYGTGVRGVANQRWAFSDINAPRKGAYGSVQNVPMSRVSPRMEKFVRQYLADRAAGRESIVGQNVSYANPYYLGEASASTKAWVREVEAQAKASGQTFGSGKAVHVHGTPLADRSKMPSPYNVKIGGGVGAVAIGATQAQASMPSAAIPQSLARPSSGQTTNIDVKVGDIKVQTTASTVTGVANDAGRAMTTQVLQLTQPMH